MTGSSAEGFRLGNEILAFRFVATLGERRADPVERIATPEQLRAWLTVNGLGGADMPVSETHLRDARTLREAIHRAGTALASGGVPEAADEEVLNRWAARHRARLVLSGGRRAGTSRTATPRGPRSPSSPWTPSRPSAALVRV